MEVNVGNINTCPYFYGSEYASYVIEYRGDFIGQMSKVDYACGYEINSKLAAVTMKPSDYERIKVDVPSILFIEFRSIFTLEESSPSNTSNIHQIKESPYLGLNGQGIIVGIIDSGIDYLNENFIDEEGKTRIVTLLDENIKDESADSADLGKVFSQDDINKAIETKNNGGDPYTIVPSKDEIEHGTKMAGIIGGRSVSGNYEGVAQRCEFAIVKLIPSTNYEKIFNENGIYNVTAYNNSEIIYGIEYLRSYAAKKKKPIIMFLGLGSTGNAHDGTGILSRYISEVCTRPGIAFVTGTGNEGNAEGHVTKFISKVGDTEDIELVVPKEMKYFTLQVWVKRPNKMSINIISPSGEERGFIVAKNENRDMSKFIYENTTLEIFFYIPEDITGHEVISIEMTDLKPGIWKFKLRGDYIADGRVDIWLQQKNTIPEGTKFLEPNPLNTLTVPATANKVIACAYYNSENNSIVSESGKGFDINAEIKPDIAAPGINILTTKVGGGLATVSGSSSAAAITTGVCALLLQWGILQGNDPTLNAIKLKSYLILGAKRIGNYTYPNTEWGYGLLDLQGIFNILSGKRSLNRNKYKEYLINNLFIRLPIDMEDIENETT